MEFGFDGGAGVCRSKGHLPEAMYKQTRGHVVNGALGQATTLIATLVLIWAPPVQWPSWARAEMSTRADPSVSLTARVTDKSDCRPL